MEIDKEWQQQPQTKWFCQLLANEVARLKEEATTSEKLTIEQIAIKNIEICSEVRVYEEIIELLTKTEQKDDESIGLETL